MEFSEVFYTFLITSIIGMVLGVGRMCYKSKCKEVSFCCFKIIRDVETEEKEMEFNKNRVNSMSESDGKIPL